MENPLEIAEYYYIKHNKNIGPLRYSISQALKTDISPVESGAHIELINLRSQQIYTTNYDDLIEKTYKALNIKADVIALANDVANIHNGEYQVVKFHGDLKYENTLVLTESSYYSRLNFDTPMDIKFRGDILGKAVLFMGYSFRDINIRIIWFKLMEMMKGISQNNKPISYIIRFTNNPVLEELYESVGIKTIILDPYNQFTNPEDMKKLFSEFMFELANESSKDGYIPFSKQKLFFSYALYNRTMGLLDKYFSEEGCNSSDMLQLTESLKLVYKREIPKDLYKCIEKLLLYCSGENFNLKFLNSDLMLFVSEIAIKIMLEKGFSDNVFLTLLSGFTFNQKARNNIFDSEIDWALFWEQKLIPAHAERFLIELKKFFTLQKDGLFLGNEEPIPYLIDIAYRIKDGHLVHNLASNIRIMAEELIKELSADHESVKNYTYSKEKPEVNKISKEIFGKSNLVEFKFVF